jgi:hypothetical protein
VKQGQSHRQEQGSCGAVPDEQQCPGMHTLKAAGASKPGEVGKGAQQRQLSLLGWSCTCTQAGARNRVNQGRGARSLTHGC